MKNKYIYSSLALTSAAFVIQIPIQAEASTVNFTDVSAGTEMGDAIINLAERKIINGYEDHTFRPYNHVTRAQAAKIIAGALHLDTKNVAPLSFTDVPTSHFAYSSISALVELGVLSANSEKFRPNDPITRAQIAKIIALAFRLEPYDYLLDFKDTTSHWAEPYIKTLAYNKVTNGISPSLFGVERPVTRGQLATFIIRSEKVAPTLYSKYPTHTINGFEDRTTYRAYYENHWDKMIYEVIEHENSIDIKALEPGIAFIQINHQMKTPGEYGIYDVREEYYKITITQNGHALEMDVMPLEHFVKPSYFSSYDTILNYSIRHTDGRAVPAIHLSDSIAKYGYTGGVTLYNYAGQFIMDVTYENGLTDTIGWNVEESTEAAMFDNIVGYYVEDTYKIRLKTPVLMPVDLTDLQKNYFYELHNGRYISTEGNFDLEIQPDAFIITPKKEGVYALELQDSKGRNTKCFFTVKEFYNGYIVDFSY